MDSERMKPRGEIAGCFRHRIIIHLHVLTRGPVVANGGRCTRSRSAQWSYTTHIVSMWLVRFRVDRRHSEPRPDRGVVACDFSAAERVLGRVALMRERRPSRNAAIPRA